MTYQQWLEEQGLSWSEYCMLEADEKEVLREQFAEYSHDLYAEEWRY